MCNGPTDPGVGEDYLSPALRAEVDQLKASVAAQPTDAETIAERARILADWIDAYALAGNEVGLTGPNVRLQATLPPTGAGRGGRSIGWSGNSRCTTSRDRSAH